jgi:hypothetical protein
VSSPDAAFQFSPCLPSQVESQVVDAIQSIGSDVHTACQSGSERVGIWLQAPSGRDDAAVRDRGVADLNVLQSGETFAAMVSAAAIYRKAFNEWRDDNVTPKRLNGDGKPDPHGPVHLTDFQVDFQSPNKVTSTIRGYDERPWPDVDFTLTTTDTLSVSGGRVKCQSAEHFDVDTSVLNLLTGVFGVLVPPLGLIFGIEDIIVSGTDAPDIDNRGSLGCPAAHFFLNGAS